VFFKTNERANARYNNNNNNNKAFSPKQIGQSKSSPSATNEASFFNKSGFLDTSATKVTDISISSNKDISKVKSTRTKQPQQQQQQQQQRL